jgi:riboflavin biosynthesis pyrimidine reductase
MHAQSDQDPAGEQRRPVLLERLLPPGDRAGVAQIVEDLGLWHRPVPAPPRARVLLNMVSTVDGRATLGGRSGPISDRADRALFHGLRSAVDAVLVGAGTVRVERYGRIIPDAAVRALRSERGLSEEPLACIVAGHPEHLQDVPLLDQPQARVAILTASADSVPASAAHLDYVRAARDGQLDLAAALEQLGTRFHVLSVLCEGGPHLAYQLLAAGLVDELFLSLTAKLAGEPATGQALRIIAGGELQPPVELELLGVLRSDAHLFLRYGVPAGERVSRATTSSSSLAS